LFAVIGDDFGVGDTTTTFNLPDFRGRFLRGWDHAAGLDPDAATRTNRGDTVTGDHVGTKQADGFKSHLHTFSLTPNVNSGSSAASNYNTGDYVTTNTSSTGGNETRPANINIMYCIKY
jgi:microcystin-dependent protein